MEVVTLQRAELGVLQRERVIAGLDDHVLSDLRSVIKNAGKVAEHTLAELDRVVRTPVGVEILDDVLAEMRSEHKRVRTAIADKGVIASRAIQRIAPT